MQEAVLVIERLLRQHGVVYEANLAEIAATTCAQSPAGARALLVADGGWGDHDSIAAVDLAVAGGFTPEARRDGQASRAALVEVFSELREMGTTDARMDLVARHFDKWSVSGV